MIHAIIQDQRPEIYALAGRAGYTHAIVHCDPFDREATRHLTMASDAGMRVVLRPRQWARPGQPELMHGRRGWVEIPPEWLPRNAAGCVPPKPYSINSMPSPWCAAPWEAMGAGLREAEYWCKNNGVEVAGVYVGCSGEVGFPRQYGAPGPTDWLWCHDRAALASWPFSGEPAATLAEDVEENGGATLQWMLAALAGRLLGLAGPTPWIPIQPAAWPAIGDASCVQGMVDLLTQCGQPKAVWLYCALYGVPKRPQSAELVSGSVLTVATHKMTAIVGSEHCEGLLGGWAERARRDGFAGLLTNPAHIADRNVNAVSQKLRLWSAGA